MGARVVVCTLGDLVCTCTPDRGQIMGTNCRASARRGVAAGAARVVWEPNWGPRDPSSVHTRLSMVCTLGFGRFRALWRGLSPSSAPCRTLRGCRIRGISRWQSATTPGAWSSIRRTSSEGVPDLVEGRWRLLPDCDIGRVFMRKGAATDEETLQDRARHIHGQQPGAGGLAGEGRRTGAGCS